MGRIPVKPRPQFPGESNEDYAHYLDTEYRAYLMDGLNQSQHMTDVAIAVIVILVLFAVMLVTGAIR